MQLPTERLKRKIEKENLWLFVLSTLKEKATNGAEIKRMVTDRFGFLTGNVTVYKVLYLLEDGGYVESREDGREVIYTLTDKGKGELEEAKEYLTETADDL